ncbi:MAG TPA: coenzyme F420-0:L-glutamate ligase [Xanthobacteraceae bacterium]|jgi:coenzyme F420-0:L-glutamate ligase/coenzyme F420-1:gamma-L-glutamate ligase
MNVPDRLTLTVVPGIPLIAPGDDLGKIIIEAIVKSGLQLIDGDILVVAQKVVSKAQGRFVDLATVVPSAQARDVATRVDKDPRLVEVILSESVRVVRERRSLLIVEHRSGYVAANAGVDQSNVAPPPKEDLVLLLPKDADMAAAELRACMEQHFAARIGVIVSDSFGRPWRLGTVGIALGASGVAALNDLRGRPDLHGRPLQVTMTAFADEVASAASLLMGQAAESHPVIVVSGFAAQDGDLPAKSLIRPAAEDLFR